MSSQYISDPTDVLEEQIRTYTRTFPRTSLIPVYPLDRLTAPTPVRGFSQHTTIHRCRSQIMVPVGTTGHLEVPTVLLCFDLPRCFFKFRASGSIHVPLSMWSDREPTHTSLFPDDDRAPDLQIGDSEVRSAIYYHIVARRRAFQRGMDPLAMDPLFGQVLLRQFAALMTNNLRYFVLEVPRGYWTLLISPPGPVLRWDSEEYKRDQPDYKGPLGRFYSLHYSGQGVDEVSLVFIVKPESQYSPLIFWGTSVPALDLETSPDNVRSEVVARISLEVDPPIHI